MEIKILITEYATTKYPDVTNCRPETQKNRYKREQLINRLMGAIDITGEISYEREQTDCRTCSKCEDMIISDMYRLVVDIGERIVSDKFVYCERCYFNIINQK